MKMSRTLRRPNVATLGQLLCKSTSINVATSQRRDVSANSAFSALKANGGADLEASGGMVRIRARKSEQE